MDTIKYLLGIIAKIVALLFVAVIIMWFVGLLYPQWKLSNIFSAVFKEDWLPAPRQIGTISKNVSKDNYGREYTHGKEYVPGPEYNGYSYPGARLHSTSTDYYLWGGNTSAYAERHTYVRNLSIYDGGDIYFNKKIQGEARNELFRNGSLPVLISGSDGRALTQVYGLVKDTWSVPGWSRFEIHIQTSLPRNENCFLTFSSTPNLFRMPVRCN